MDMGRGRELFERGSWKRNWSRIQVCGEGVLRGLKERREIDGSISGMIQIHSMEEAFKSLWK